MQERRSCTKIYAQVKELQALKNESGALYYSLSHYPSVDLEPKDPANQSNISAAKKMITDVFLYLSIFVENSLATQVHCRRNINVTSGNICYYYALWPPQVRSVADKCSAFPIYFHASTSTLI